MTTVVLGRRSHAVARSTTDRRMLASFLEQDRLYSAYALCDLEEKEFGTDSFSVSLLTKNNEPLAHAKNASYFPSRKGSGSLVRL